MNAKSALRIPTHFCSLLLILTIVRIKPYYSLLRRVLAIMRCQERELVISLCQERFTSMCKYCISVADTPIRSIHSAIPFELLLWFDFGTLTGLTERFWFLINNRHGSRSVCLWLFAKSSISLRSLFKKVYSLCHNGSAGADAHHKILNWYLA